MQPATNIAIKNTALCPAYAHRLANTPGWAIPPGQRYF